MAWSYISPARSVYVQKSERHNMNDTPNNTNTAVNFSAMKTEPRKDDDMDKDLAKNLFILFFFSCGVCLALLLIVAVLTP